MQLFKAEKQKEKARGEHEVAKLKKHLQAIAEFRMRHSDILLEWQKLLSKKADLENDARTAVKAAKRNAGVDGLTAQYTKRRSTVRDAEMLRQLCPDLEVDHPALFDVTIDGAEYKELVKRGRIPEDVQNKIESKVISSEAVKFVGDLWFKT